MDIHEYISSGIIEKYVMGLASPQEREEFDRLQSHFPELAKARLRFESSLEEKAREHAIDPPPFLKEKLLDVIRQHAAEETNVLVPGDRKKLFRRGPGIYWTIAACVILLGGCLGLIWFFYQKNAELKAEMTTLEMKKDSLGQKIDLIDEQLGNAKQVKMSQFLIPENGMTATIRLYWDSTSKDVYMVVSNLPLLAPEQQYQIWAFTKGHSKSLGLFDAPMQDKLILKLNEVQNADSFTITIEKRPLHYNPGK